MSLWARSDLASVSVSPAHGGCGLVHNRPAPGGKPADLWELDCPACSDHLRHDPLWSTTLSEIPETHDEKNAREDFDKRGARDKDQVLAMALAKLAGVELPESLLRPITGNMPRAVAMMECPSGHPGKPGSKFCATCGEPMQQPVNALTAAPVLCKRGHENAVTAKFCGECGTPMAEGLKVPYGNAQAPQAQAAHLTPGGEPEPAAGDLASMHWKQLEKLCKDRGLDATGSKTDLLARLGEPTPVAA